MSARFAEVDILMPIWGGAGAGLQMEPQFCNIVVKHRGDRIHVLALPLDEIELIIMLV